MNQNLSHYLLDPNKRVDFVNASQKQDPNSTSKESEVEFQWKQLSGAEVREFYETLLLQPSTSSENFSISNDDYSSEKNSRFKSRILNNKHRSKAKTQMTFTDRDFRLFLKSAAENDLISLENYHVNGMSLEIQDMFRWTALMCASAAGSADVVDYLLRNGANSEQTDCSGRSALDLARKNNHFHVLELFENFSQFKDETQLVSSMARKCDLSKGFCTLCQLYYTDEDGRHDASIVHMINTGQLPSQGYSYEIPSDNKGYRLLKNSGWNETMGLGRDGEGRMCPIKTILKRDLKGLGMGKKMELRVTHFQAFDKRAIEGPSTSKNIRRGHFLRGIEKKRQRERKMEIEFRNLFND